MKKLKINIPEGYEIDKENSTFEEIVFKKLGPKLPTSWKEYCEQNSKPTGYFISSRFDLQTFCFNDEDMICAYTALCRLHKLRDVYRQGWVPDWGNDLITKYCIVSSLNDLDIYRYTQVAHFLAFQSKEIAEEFLKNFRDLIEKAKDLI